jgi:hypothetical protein
VNPVFSDKGIPSVFISSFRLCRAKSGGKVSNETFRGISSNGEQSGEANAAFQRVNELWRAFYHVLVFGKDHWNNNLFAFLI